MAGCGGNAIGAVRVWCRLAVVGVPPQLRLRSIYIARAPLASASLRAGRFPARPRSCWGLSVRLAEGLVLTESN